MVVAVVVVDAKHMPPHVAGQACWTSGFALQLASVMPVQSADGSGRGCAPLHSSQSSPPHPPPKAGLQVQTASRQVPRLEQAAAVSHSKILCMFLAPFWQSPFLM